jgi:hypothetical protein
VFSRKEAQKAQKLNAIEFSVLRLLSFFAAKK